MSGYKNRLIRLDFTEELSEDPDNDKIWVSLRNPKLMAPGELTPAVPEAAADDDTETSDGEEETAVGTATVEGMYGIFSRLIVAWRVYDATIEVDKDGNEKPQKLLPMPATVDRIQKLPQSIILELSSKVAEAVNPS